MENPISSIIEVSGYINSLIFSSFSLKIILVIILLLIGFIIAKIFGKLSQKILHELELNLLLKKIKIKVPLEYFIGKLIEYAIYLITVVIALNQLGITKTVIIALISAALVICALAAIFGIRGFVPNLIAFFTIYRKDLFNEGDKIKVKNVEGTVDKIGITETQITTKKETIFIPNVLAKTAKLIRKSE